MPYYIQTAVKLGRYFTIIYIWRGCRGCRLAQWVCRWVWRLPGAGGCAGAGGEGVPVGVSVGVPVGVPVGKAVERGGAFAPLLSGHFLLNVSFQYFARSQWTLVLDRKSKYCESPSAYSDSDPGI